MNEEFDPEMYDLKCHQKPLWIKNANDAMRYAAHVCHRMYQAQADLKLYCDSFQKENKEAFEKLQAKSFEIRQRMDDAFKNSEENNRYIWDCEEDGE